MSCSLWLWHLCCVLLAACVFAEVDQNIIGDDAGFAFAAKFCFDFNAVGSTQPVGRMSVHLSTVQSNSPNQPGNLTLAIYDDDSWPLVWGTPLSCTQKISHAKHVFPIVFSAAGQWDLPDKNRSVYEHSRPRFMYLAVAHTSCLSTGSIMTDIHFQNTNVDAWYQEFGVNERGLNDAYIVFSTIFIILTAFHPLKMRSFVRTASFHPLHITFTVSLALMTASVFIFMVHYIVFAYNGIGLLPLQGFASVLDAVARVAFTLVLILTAKRHIFHIDHFEERTHILVVVGGLLLFNFILLIYDVAQRDDASTLYLYESTPGVMLVAVNALAGLWFCVSIYSAWSACTLADQKHTLKWIGIMFAPWHFLLLVMVVLASLLDAWVREKVVTISYLSWFAIYYAIGILSFSSASTSSLLNTPLPDVGGLISEPSARSILGSTPYESL